MAKATKHTFQAVTLLPYMTGGRTLSLSGGQMADQKLGRPFKI